MSTAKTIELGSWEEFKNAVFPTLFGEPRFSPNRYLFRGHGRGDWSLTTSFDRWYRLWGKDRSRIELANQLLHAFISACENHGLKSQLDANSAESIAVAQHYGVPTRLLDWTESPYIAAFFAYHSNLTLTTEPHDVVAVWALDEKIDIWSKEYGVEVIKASRFTNERLRNQAGAFTLSRTPFESLEEYVERHSSPRPPLFRFLLPASDVRIALADLAAMGITPARMFADLEGAAASAVQQVILGLKT